MYIDSISIGNVRTFGQTPYKNKDKPPKRVTLELIHPERDYRPARTVRKPGDLRLPAPRLPNVTLILGDNGSGKSTVLKALAAAAFGPTARDILRDNSMIRRGEISAGIEASLRLHLQDRAEGEIRKSILELELRGERLEVEAGTGETRDPKEVKKQWGPVYESHNDAYFIVGYGATRRIERMDSYDSAARLKSRTSRDLRVQSLFEDSFSLIPLASWLPKLKQGNPGRYAQIEHLMNDLLKPGQYHFTGKQHRGDYLYERGGISVPSQALSDGYRAFIGWVADLMYHVCFGCPTGKKLRDSKGIVLVDEIDLHLHPSWQMKVIPTIANALPNMQFVFTSHSPLVAGSLEWMNIITLKIGSTTNQTIARRLKQSVHGLDADQILLTDFFGLKSTRASSKRAQLTRLRQEATIGGDEDKLAYIRALSSGMEAVDAPGDTVQSEPEVAE